jgi:hypothetical protein
MKLNDVKAKERYEVRTKNKFAALERLVANVDIKRT